MKRNVYHKRRRFGPEQLETRQMLAGDVTVSVNAGHLWITGDADDNSISISATANPNEYTISPADGDTTINGGAAPVTIGGATMGASISLDEDHDSIEFDTTNRAIHFDGQLDIQLGSSSVLGNSVSVIGDNGMAVAGYLRLTSEGEFDDFRFNNVNVSGNVNIDLGPNLDLDARGWVRFVGGSVTGDFRVDTYGEYDVDLRMDVLGDVFIGSGNSGDTYHIESSIGGSLTAYLYNSHLDVHSTEIGGDLIVEGAAWITVQNTWIDRHVLMELFQSQIGSQVSFVGHNWTTAFNHVGGNFVVTMDANDPSVILEYLNVDNDLVVRGGDGVDSARLNNVRAGNSLLIDTGAGDDVVWIHNSSADGEAAILGGAGSDYVLVGNFLGARSLFLDTGAGFDLVNVSYASFGQNLYVWLGGDSDQATVYAVSAHYLSADAGSGYDSVAIQYSAADHLFAGLGEGNDSLTVTGSLVRASALLDGGAGGDLFSGSGNLLKGLSLINFEAT